jgi:hypothetical protein
VTCGSRRVAAVERSALDGRIRVHAAENHADDDEGGHEQSAEYDDELPEPAEQDAHP